VRLGELMVMEGGERSGRRTWTCAPLL